MSHSQIDCIKMVNGFQGQIFKSSDYIVIRGAEGSKIFYITREGKTNKRNFLLSLPKSLCLGNTAIYQKPFNEISASDQFKSISATSLLYNRPYRATARAKTPLICLQMSDAEYKRLIEPILLGLEESGKHFDAFIYLTIKKRNLKHVYMFFMKIRRKSVPLFLFPYSLI